MKESSNRVQQPCPNFTVDRISGDRNAACCGSQSKFRLWVCWKREFLCFHYLLKFSCWFDCQLVLPCSSFRPFLLFFERVSFLDCLTTSVIVLLEFTLIVVGEMSRFLITSHHDMVYIWKSLFFFHRHRSWKTSLSFE